MIRGKDNLLQWVRYNDVPRWKIYPYQGQKTTFIAAASEECTSMDASIADLEKTLSWMAEGRYRIVCKGVDEKKGFAETAFEHLPNGAAAQPAQPHMSGSFHNNIDMEVQRRVDAEVGKFKLEHSIAELNKEIIALKTGKKPKTPKAWEKRMEMFLDHCQHYITPALFSQLGLHAPVPAQVHVSGSPEATATETETEDKDNPSLTPEGVKRLQLAIAKGLAADADFITVIEKIAEVAANEPATYSAYKPLLLKD